MEDWIKHTIDTSEFAIHSNTIRSIIFGNRRLEALLTNYVSSVHESIAFPLIKHSSDSYLKYLDVFPFWKLRNWFLNAEVTRFQKQTHAALKSDERQAKVLIRIDSGQRFQLTLLQLQQFLPTIHDLLMNQQPDSGNTFKIHLAQLSFHWMSTYMSCVRDPNYVISKWTVAYEDFLCQLDLSLAFGCSEMAEFWYNSFSYMVPTLAGKLWLKMHTIRRFRLFTSVSAIRKALNNKFEQFTLDPLFMQISAYELSNWLIERSLGVSDELILYLGTLKWFNFDWIDRKQYMVPLMNHIHFSSMTLIQVVGCFFPPLLPEIATQPQVRAMLDLALYNVQMQIKLYKWKREYKRTRVPAIDRAAPGLKVWIDDLETSLHQISRENESKVYGLPIEQDETLQWERIRWRHLKRKDEMFQAKLKESICLADSQTKSLQVSKEPLSVTKISVDEIPSTAEKSFRTSLHHLKFAVELKPNGAKLAKSLVSCERVARLPIDYFVWKTCDCMYKLHVTNQKCMLGIGMRRSSPIKLQDKIDRNILDVDWQARNEFRLFYLVKRPHRYTLAWSDRYFGKAIHQNRIELSVEYMSLLVLGSPIIGVGNEYIWRLDLGRHVYAPLNWYTFRSLLPLKSTGRMVTWPVDAVAVDWQDQLLFVSGRMYQQRESIACKRNSANQQDTPEDAVIMPTLKYSPCRMLDDRLMTGRDSSNLKLPTVDQLSLSPKCYIYSITRKRMQEVGSLGQERCNHVVVKCWIDNEERVLAIGGENRFGKIQKSIEMFDGKRWMEWQSLPEPLSGAACVFIPFYINKYYIENKYFKTLWVLGGWMPITRSNKNKSVQSAESSKSSKRPSRLLSNVVFWFDIQRHKWHRYPVPLPQPLAFGSAVFHNECIYLAGGIRQTTTGDLSPTSDCWVLDLSLGKWIQVFPLLFPRSRISMVSIGNRLLAIGGADASGWPTRHVEMIMNNGLGWCQQVDIPVAISGQQVVTFKIHDLPEPNLDGGEFTTEWQWRPEVLERVIDDAEHLMAKKIGFAE